LNEEVILALKSKERFWISNIICESKNEFELRVGFYNGDKDDLSIESKPQKCKIVILKSIELKYPNGLNYFQFKFEKLTEVKCLVINSR